MGQITVYFKPITIGSVATPYYHAFYVYTNDNGDRFYLRGGPSTNANGTIDFSNGGGFGSEGFTFSGSGGNFPFGHIWVQSGAYEPGTPDWESNLSSLANQTFWSGNDATIGPTWTDLVNWEMALNPGGSRGGTDGVAYGLAGPNSNAVVGDGAAHEGHALPSLTGMNQAYSAPGMDIPMSASFGSLFAANLALISNMFMRGASALWTEIQSLAAGFENTVSHLFQTLFGTNQVATENLVGTPGFAPTNNGDGTYTFQFYDANGTLQSAHVDGNGNVSDITNNEASYVFDGAGYLAYMEGKLSGYRHCGSEFDIVDIEPFNVQIMIDDGYSGYIPWLIYNLDDGSSVVEYFNNATEYYQVTSEELGGGSVIRSGTFAWSGGGITGGGGYSGGYGGGGGGCGCGRAFMRTAMTSDSVKGGAMASRSFDPLLLGQALDGPALSSDMSQHIADFAASLRAQIGQLPAFSKSGARAPAPKSNEAVASIDKASETVLARQTGYADEGMGSISQAALIANRMAEIGPLHVDLAPSNMAG